MGAGQSLRPKKYEGAKIANDPGVVLITSYNQYLKLSVQMQLLLSDHGSKSVVIQYDRQHDADRILSILADIYKMYRITGPNIRLTAGSIYFEYIDKSKIVPASIKATLKDVVAKTDERLVKNTFKPLEAFLMTEFLENRIEKFLRTGAYATALQKCTEVKIPLGSDAFHYGEILGYGSYGWVVKARKKTTNQEYAIKIQPKGVFIRHFAPRDDLMLMERHIMALLSKSPFIGRLEGAFQTDHQVIAVMEYVDGISLKDVLRRSNYKLTIEEARYYGAEILLGLEHMHEKKILHRDIKPDNIMLTRYGHVKIVDLGLSVPLPECTSLDISMTVEMQRQGGTRLYMSPEMIDIKRNQDKKIGYSYGVDIWSLGVIMYEMLTGYPPFDFEAHQQDIEKQRQARNSLLQSPDETSAEEAVESEFYTTFSSKHLSKGQSSPKKAAIKKNQDKMDEMTKIIRNGFDVPDSFSQDVTDMFKRIFEPDMDKRITLKELKHHPFFNPIDWKKMFAKAATGVPYDSSILLRNLDPPFRRDIAFKSYESLLRHIQKIMQKKVKKAALRGQDEKEKAQKRLHGWQGRRVSTKRYDFSPWDFTSQRILQLEWAGEPQLPASRGRKMSLQAQYMIAK